MERAKGIVNSASAGDPARFASWEALVSGLDSLAPAPTDRGRVAGIVTRWTGGRRVPLLRARLTPEGGIPADAWRRREGRKLEAQIAVMQAGVAALIANGQPMTLFGDGLFLDLDLSEENLPPGSRVRAGGAALEVTPKPHHGCAKFRTRFGDDALCFVSDAALRHRNLRGIYLRVVEEGDVGPGDEVVVVSRVSPSDTNRPAAPSPPEVGHHEHLVVRQVERLPIVPRLDRDLREGVGG